MVDMIPLSHAKSYRVDARGKELSVLIKDSIRQVQQGYKVTVVSCDKLRFSWITLQPHAMKMLIQL
jgi:hypothetical protein